MGGQDREGGEEGRMEKGNRRRGRGGREEEARLLYQAAD